MSDHDALGEPSEAFVAPPVKVRGSVAVARSVQVVILEAYDAHQRDLYGFARALVRDREAAEDLVADAFLRLIREIAAGRMPERTRPWLFRVVANQAINQARRRAIGARILERLVDRGAVEPADAGLLRREEAGPVRRALLDLPVDMRTALLLAAHGFSGREIAEAIGRSDAATRTLLSRGRVRLRERLEQAGSQLEPSGREGRPR